MTSLPALQICKAVLTGSVHEGGRRAAAIYTLIETAKLNDVDPQAWLADVLARLQDYPAKRIAELLPWNWKRKRQQKAAA
jgi:transposase